MLRGEHLVPEKARPQQVCQVDVHGVYLGIRTVNGEKIVGTAEGVWRTRTVQRKTLAERWGSDTADLVGGCRGTHQRRTPRRMDRLCA